MPRHLRYSLNRLLATGGLHTVPLSAQSRIIRLAPSGRSQTYETQHPDGETSFRIEAVVFRPFFSPVRCHSRKKTGAKALIARQLKRHSKVLSILTCQPAVRSDCRKAQEPEASDRPISLRGQDTIRRTFPAIGQLPATRTGMLQRKRVRNAERDPRLPKQTKSHARAGTQLKR